MPSRIATNNLFPLNLLVRISVCPRCYTSPVVLQRPARPDCAKLPALQNDPDYSENRMRWVEGHAKVGTLEAQIPHREGTVEAAELLTLLTTALGVGRLVGWRWMAEIADCDFRSRCRFASGPSELAKAKCLPAGTLYRLGPVLMVIEWESFRPAPAGDWGGFGTSSPGGQVTEYGYFFGPPP